MSQTKKCVQCKRHLSYDNFYRREGKYYFARCRECHIEAGKEIYDRQKQREGERGKEGVLRLDARPFSQWLRELYEQEKRAAEFENPGVTGEHIKKLALPQVRSRIGGMPERRLWALLRDRQSTVHIDTVDKALVNEGRTDHVSKLREMYPALYQFDEETA